MGLVVSKAVGNAVTRHDTSRKLRNAFRAVLDEREIEFPAGTCVVIRALPASARASNEELVADVRSCIRRALR
mgnify:FL=1